MIHVSISISLPLPQRLPTYLIAFNVNVTQKKKNTRGEKDIFSHKSGNVAPSCTRIASLRAAADLRHVSETTCVIFRFLTSTVAKQGDDAR